MGVLPIALSMSFLHWKRIFPAYIKYQSLREATLLFIAAWLHTASVLCGCTSDKLDVEDHYVAWRQTHDSPQHAMGVDGPFSFCSYPFLLNPRAKSKLLHTEARFLMTQVPHPANV